MSIDRKTTRRSIILVLMGVLAALGGCSSFSETPGYTPRGEEILNEVWSMYRSHLNVRKWPPARLTDLDPYEPAAINGYAALRDGEVVMLWGGAAPSAGAGARVLAYEKLVPEQGGSVLYQDGTVRQLSGAEFQAALKVR